MAPRRWWLAGFLSIIMPGLGQVYNGQARKGITLLLISPLFALIFPLALYADNIVLSLLAIVAIGVCFFVYVFLDAIVTAWRLRVEYTPRKYNNVIVYTGVIAAFFVAEHFQFSNLSSEYIKQNYLQAYRIPAESMKPTLLIGDHILVDRRPVARNPKHGEIIVFRVSARSQKRLCQTGCRYGRRYCFAQK